MVNTARVVLVLLLGLLCAPTASAAPTGDSVDQFGIDYVVTPDGTLRVTETIVYRFGPSSGRHGIIRDLLVREPANTKDQRYDISAVTVASPNAPTTFTTETLTASGGRQRTLRLKIGSPTQTVSAPTATYVITYQVHGALRHFDDHTELYWNATGGQWQASLAKVTVQVTAPDGVQKTQCYAGPSGSTKPCTQATVVDNKGVFTQEALGPQQGLTIVAAVKPGLVTNDTPILDDPPTLLTRLGLSSSTLVGSVIAALVIPLLGFAYRRRAFRDERFVDVPPGVTGGKVGRDHLHEDQIPVAFTPPRIPVAEGGLLFDGVSNSRETAATLVDLAVRGAVRIQNKGAKQLVVLLDPAKAAWPHEGEMLRKLFPGLRRGSTALLQRGQRQVAHAHNAMTTQLRRQVEGNNWYKRPPRNRSGPGPGRLVVLIVVAVLSAGFATFVALDDSPDSKLVNSDGFTLSAGGYLRIVTASLLPMLALLFTWLALRRVRRRGQRNALGRAITDQLLGFRLYLATAEAHQLRFEEGEDIFSRYLPWAIVFELADRWQRICAQLAAQGRIPAEPDWYSGPSYYDSGPTSVVFADNVSSAAGPYSGSSGGSLSSSGFSDSGGSSGGGGGSSDSGGGGGGGSSW